MEGWPISLIKSPADKSGETPPDRSGYHIRRTHTQFSFLAHACILKFAFPCFCPFWKPVAFGKNK